MTLKRKESRGYLILPISKYGPGQTASCLSSCRCWGLWKPRWMRSLGTNSSGLQAVNGAAWGHIFGKARLQQSRQFAHRAVLTHARQDSISQTTQPEPTAISFTNPERRGAPLILLNMKLVIRRPVDLFPGCWSSGKLLASHLLKFHLRASGALDSKDYWNSPRLPKKLIRKSLHVYKLEHLGQDVPGRAISVQIDRVNFCQSRPGSWFLYRAFFDLSDSGDNSCSLINADTGGLLLFIVVESAATYSLC